MIVLENRVYLCIDLKCFFASVECVARHLDPFETNLVVADPTRGQGALCLAISPKMKAEGVKNRCRLYEIPKGVEYQIAIPRMKLYMEYSADIYAIYLKYVSDKDIHVYSIDEAFLDITEYLHLYKLSAKTLAQRIMTDILETTGITATAGIGTNMYLAKIALDILAKHRPDHIGVLNETLYQKYFWDYPKLTDFWHIGKGIENRLNQHELYTMKDIAYCNENILYKEFGVNAEYLIDHAWGREPTTIADIKKYHSKSKSISNSQVLFEDYDYPQALIVMKEMVELKVLDLCQQHLVTDCIYLHVGYSKNIIRGTGGSRKLGVRTNSYKVLLEAFVTLFKETTNRDYKIRTIAVSFGNVVDEYYESYDLFTDFKARDEEKKIQAAILDIKQKYGKNAILKGMNLLDGATTIKRNTLVGGHNAE